MRQAVGKTQADLARVLGVDQTEISKRERRSDLRLSTVREYAEALHCRCEIVFVSPDGDRTVIRLDRA